MRHLNSEPEWLFRRIPKVIFLLVVQIMCEPLTFYLLSLKLSFGLVCLWVKPVPWAVKGWTMVILLGQGTYKFAKSGICLNCETHLGGIIQKDGLVKQIYYILCIKMLFYASHEDGSSRRCSWRPKRKYLIFIGKAPLKEFCSCGDMELKCNHLDAGEGKFNSRRFMSYLSAHVE